jgi:uncharacterized protein (TIGR02145 family)
MGMTPQQLVQNWLVGQGVVVSNCTFNGSPGVITSDQVGTFLATGGAITQLGLESGVLMTSGAAQIAVGPNNSPGAGASTFFNNDPDLDIIAGVNTNDKAVIEFDFIPMADTLKFQYVFGSEEFFEYCNSYNDAFGFFLSGPGITGPFSNNSVNIALMPGSPMPVTINNLCADPTSRWDNAGGVYYQYDGLSYVFTAWHVVTPCTTYHIKLAIADALDRAYDSGVFLEKNSFTATGLLVDNSYTVPKLGSKAVEGCNEVTINFTLSQAIGIPFVVHYTVGGTATRGVDYPDIPDSLVIPPGQLNAQIVINPISDGIPEGPETVVLAIVQPSCTGTSIYYDSLFIFDPIPMGIVPRPDTTICFGDSVRLYCYPWGGLRPYNYLWNIPLGSDTAITVSPPVGNNMYIVAVTDLCSQVVTDTQMVVVKPVPHFTNPSMTSTICPGGTTNIVFQTNAPGSTFTWIATNPGGHITGWASGSGPSIIQTLQNNSIFRDTVFYTVSVQALGCQGRDTVFRVIVQPKPNVVVNNTTPNVCDGTIINIGLSSGVPGTTFSWTATGSSLFVTGFTNGSGILISDKLYNSGNTIDTVKYFITPTANGCPGTVVVAKVVVSPVPSLTNNPLSKTICSNQLTNIPLTSNVVGAGFTWTTSLMSGTVTGFSNGAGTIINQLLVNTGFIPGVVRYRIFPNANGCAGPPADYNVTVNPVPDLSNVPNRYPVCSGNTANITLLSNVAGTTFTWTAVPSSGNLSGFTNGSGTVINDVLVNSGTVTDSVAYTITPSANGCTGIPRTIYAVVYPVPNASSAPPNATICSGQATSFTLSSLVSGTTFSWTAVPSSGNVTGFSAGAGTLIAQTLTNSGNISETVTYTVTPVVPGCPPGPSTAVVATVRPVPLLTNAPLSKSICDNTSPNVTLLSNVAGTLFTWTCTPSSGNITGWSNNAVPTTLLNQVLDNTGFNTESVTYHVTPSANGCAGPVADYTVTVFPTPNLSNPPPLFQQVCHGQTTNITLTSNVAGTGFTWTCVQTSGNVTGWSPNPGPPATGISQTLGLTGNVSDSVLYLLTPVSNGCTGTIYTYKVRVNPYPYLLTDPMFDTICSGQTTDIWLIATCAGTTFTWSAAPGSGNVTGFANGTGDHIAQTLTNNLNTLGSVFYTITPATPTCTGPDTVFKVYVKPTPNLSNTPLNATLCNNTTLNLILTSGVAGTTFTWTCTPSSGNVTGWSNNAAPTTVLSQTLSNSGNVAETVTYHISPAANLCTGPVTDYVVTVYPTSTVTNLPLSQSQCDNLNTNINLTSNVAGTTFTWTCTPSSGNITGWSNNAVPTTTIAQILDNTGVNTEWVTYHVTPTANGCPGTPSDYLVTVFPTALLTNAPASKSQCDNLNTNITLTSNVAGTQFTWTCTPSSGNITGWANNAVPATTIAQVLDNTGFNTETVTYHVTPVSNGCAGPVADYLVTVYPTPNLSNVPLSMQLCNNTATNLTLTSNVAGTLFTWTCTPSSGNITGWANNVIPTVTLNQTLVNAGLTMESVTYHITPAASGCTGPVTDYVVSVVETPDVIFNPPSQTICSQQSSNIQLLSSVPSATFTWTAAGSSANVTGYSGGSGSAIVQTLTNSGNAIEWVTYQVTPVAFGCPPGLTQNVVVTVNPRPAVNNLITGFQLCTGSATNIVPTSTVAGSTYTWTASGSSGNVTGFSNGAGMTIVQTLTNSGFNIETVTYQVVPSANGCPGNATPFVVTVFPAANVLFNPNGQAFCSGGTSAINLTSSVAGASFTWTAAGSGPNITGYTPGSGNLIAQTLFNSGTAPGTALYQVSPTANGCPGILTGVVVTINPMPAVSFTACFDPVISVNSQPFQLTGGIPVGGTYSGPGVTAGQFNPSVSGPGTFTLAYSYNNTWGCPGNATATINVVALAPFVCGSPLTDPRDNQSYPSVQIGTQCWMAANLNYGNTIPSALMQRDNCVSERYCFGDNPGNCTTNGGLYQWDELMKYTAASGAQGMCPPEWHVPTEADWNILFNFYTSNGFAASALKSTGFSGFNAFLTGVRHNNVQWDFNNFAVMFWSSTSHGANKAWSHGMNTFDPSVSFYPSHRNNAFPVRCIKD